MAAFRFSLQRVLDIKRIREEQRRHELAVARAEAAACARRLEESQTALRAAIVADTDSRVDPGLRSLSWHHRSVLQARTTELRTELARRRQAVQEASRDLRVAAQEVQVLERLKERRREACQREEARREQRALDDLAGARAARPSGGETSPRRG